MRNSWLNRNPSSRSITFTPPEVENLRLLDSQIDGLVAAIGAATVGFRQAENPPDWVDSLMGATKDTIDLWQQSVRARLDQP